MIFFMMRWNDHLWFEDVGMIGRIILKLRLFLFELFYLFVVELT